MPENNQESTQLQGNVPVEQLIADRIRIAIKSTQPIVDAKDRVQRPALSVEAAADEQAALLVKELAERIPELEELKAKEPKGE